MVEQFYQMWKTCKENVVECRRQIFVNAQWLLPKQPKHDDESESEEDCELPDAIQNMIDAEVKIKGFFYWVLNGILVFQR